MNEPTPTISIRPGRTSDAATIHTLIRPFVESNLLLRRSVAEIEALTKNSVVAETNMQLVGFAAVEIYSKKLAEIQCLAVQKEFQDTGVGKQLVQACVELAAEHNILELMAISSSAKFLKACGFDYSLPGQKRALFINP